MPIPALKHLDWRNFASNFARNFANRGVSDGRFGHMRFTGHWCTVDRVSWPAKHFKIIIKKINYVEDVERTLKHLVLDNFCLTSRSKRAHELCQFLYSSPCVLVVTF